MATSNYSYLVLSLESPRRVLYVVKGKLGKGEDLVPGTMLDLKSMQEVDEGIYNIPVSDEEMKNVVESVTESFRRWNEHRLNRATSLAGSTKLTHSRTLWFLDSTHGSKKVKPIL